MTSLLLVEKETFLSPITKEVRDLILKGSGNEDN
jgi:hypothetical protein